MSGGDLARRAVACPVWRWMPGMRYRGESWGSLGWLRVSERPEHIAALNERAGDDEVPVSELLHAIRVLLPDLDDPATLGCLLALVREAWGAEPDIESSLHVKVVVWTGAGWKDFVEATLAEALVAALEAAPRREVSP